MVKKLIVFIFILNLIGCIKDIDGPINISPSKFHKMMVEMGASPEYPQKVYYDLNTMSVIKTSNSKDWSIAFTSQSYLDQKMIMNYALGVTCNGFTKKDTNFLNSVSESEFEKNQLLRYSNHYDSFANLFQDNFNGGNNGYVYYLNFGSRGNYKLKVISYSTSKVTIRYSRLDGTNEKTTDIDIKSNQNYTYFSFEDNDVKDIEPEDNTSWDLEFTRYTTLIDEFNSLQMYGVAGTLLNPKCDIEVAKFDEIKIEEIDSAKATKGNFSKKINIIGYSWKKYSSGNANGFYTIPSRTYAIKSKGKLFTIQFYEFSKDINGTLTRGYPSWLQNNF